MPDWGPSIEGLNMDQIVTYVRPNTKMKPNGPMCRKILRIHLSVLGIPEAERKSLAGVGASMIPSWFITMFVRKSLHRCCLYRYGECIDR